MFFARRSKRFLSGLIISLAVSQWPAHGGGVVTIADEATLRAALAGGGQVTLAFSGTIVLTNTFQISANTEMDASGHTVVLSGGSERRIFHVDPGVSLSLRHLTLSHGNVRGTNGAPEMDGGEAFGGAILVSNGILNLTDCRFETNSAVGGTGGSGFPTANGGAARGGAIYLLAGSLNATNTEFIGNAAVGGAGGTVDFYPGATGSGGIAQGGAVFTTNGAVHLERCRLFDNWAEGGPAPISLQGNGAASGPAEGGAIWNREGTVAVVDCEFLRNSVTSPIAGSSISGTGGSACGGAVFNSGGMSCTQSIWLENRALGGPARRHIGQGGQGRGGALYNSGVLALERCTLEANVANGGDNGSPAGNGAGGALFNSGQLRVQATSFLGNLAFAGEGYAGGNNPVVPGLGQGGAIFSQGTVTATECTFALNVAEGAPAGVAIWPYPGGHSYGGAFFNSGEAVLTNNTFSLNAAQGGSWPPEWSQPEMTARGGNAFGGAFFNTNGTAFLVNNTLAFNTSRGGIAYPNGLAFGDNIATTNGSIKAMNTLLACRAGETNLHGVIDDFGHNLSSDASCAFLGEGSLNNADPRLGPLADYGGPNETLPLLAGSEALDAGSDSGFSPVDQRGHARPFGVASDIGAFESSPPYVIRGRISGKTFTDETTVSAGASQVTTTNLGSYSLEGVSPGQHEVTPQDPDYLFVPNTSQIVVGPDRLNVDFAAYRWNALSLDNVTNGALHVLYAAKSGEDAILQASSNLVNWSSIITNVMDESQLWELFLPVGDQPSRFYRSIKP